MINVLNNLPEEYDVILNGLENHLTLSCPNVLTIKVIYKNTNHWYEKNKGKNEEKTTGTHQQPMDI